MRINTYLLVFSLLITFLFGAPQNAFAEDNVAPSVATVIAPNTNGKQVSASLAFTDQNISDTHTAVWNWGDGTTSVGTVTESNGAGSVTDTHMYPSEGIFKILVTVTDNNGLSKTTGLRYFTFNKFPIIYEDAPLALQVMWCVSNISCDEGQLELSFYSMPLDIGENCTPDDFLIYRATDNAIVAKITTCDSGAGPMAIQPSTPDAFQPNVPYYIKLVVHGGISEGTYYSQTFSLDDYYSYLRSDNTAPSLGAITSTPNPVTVNTSVTANANITDTDTSDTHTAVWNWGDGTTSTGTVTESSGSGSVAGNHAYTTAGVYEVGLTVTDNHDASTSSTYQYISVYNPTPQALFSGVRIFTSPLGAYTANPSLTGQVKFGVTAKYSGTTPTGNVKLDFKQADFDFASDTLTTLVNVGGNATIRGTGSVNGTGGYTFLVTGFDGHDTNTTDAVRFQIKNSGGNVVYDTQLNASDTASPTTSVTGQIVIH